VHAARASEKKRQLVSLLHERMDQLTRELGIQASELDSQCKKTIPDQEAAKSL
jgi:hypothetical protein